MINSLTGADSVIVLSVGNSNTYISPDSNDPMRSMMRLYDSTTQAYDGTGWISVGSSDATIQLTPDVENLLMWARKERDKQSELEALAEKHPAVSDALTALKYAQEQLDLIQILLK